MNQSNVSYFTNNKALNSTSATSMKNNVFCNFNYLNNVTPPTPYVNTSLPPHSLFYQFGVNERSNVNQFNYSLNSIQNLLNFGEKVTIPKSENFNCPNVSTNFQFLSNNFNIVQQNSMKMNKQQLYDYNLLRQQQQYFVLNNYLINNNIYCISKN